MPQGKVLVLCALMRNYRLCFMLATQNLLIAEVICQIPVHIKRSTSWISLNNNSQASRVPVCRPTRREEARVPICQPSDSQTNNSDNTPTFRGHIKQRSHRIWTHSLNDRPRRPWKSFRRWVSLFYFNNKIKCSFLDSYIQTTWALSIIEYSILDR